MVEIGKIQKPEAESYKNRKKLYYVRSIYLPEDAPEDYRELFQKYWDDVAAHLGKMETAGTITKVFCEHIFDSGKDALVMLEKMNKRAAQIVQKKLDEGGLLIPLEEKEIFSYFVDWSNCLMVVRTQEVFDRIYEFFTELSNRRFQHILREIEKNLAEGEAGLLILEDDDRLKIQFPDDIEVFLITPLSYDDLFKSMSELGKSSGDKNDFEALKE
jgi:hypothetical protein